MTTIEEISQQVSKLTAEEIQNLSDDEIIGMAMERPFHPGQYGFLLQPSFFDTDEQMGEALYQLLKRLEKVENLEEKMKKLKDQE
jgi:predicted transcriptional regulator